MFNPGYSVAKLSSIGVVFAPSFAFFHIDSLNSIARNNAVSGCAIGGNCLPRTQPFSRSKTIR
jgi:hypothetical protein